MCFLRGGSSIRILKCYGTSLDNTLQAKPNDTPLDEKCHYPTPLSSTIASSLFRDAKGNQGTWMNHQKEQYACRVLYVCRQPLVGWC